MKKIVKKTINDLKKIKDILDDKEDSIFDKGLMVFGKDISALEKRRDIISKAISGTLVPETDAFVHAIKELILLQNKKTSQNKITKITDIKSQENFSDFITFTEDDKEYHIVGDLHSDLTSFLHILESVKFKDNFDNINLVFLGDYIDRGKDKLDLINRIILLKYLLPNNIHLLRGNHELYRIDDEGNYLSPMNNADMSYLFDFLTALSKQNKSQQDDIKKLSKYYAEFFDSMPTVALFNFKDIKICAIHGGLPRVDLNSNDYYGSENYGSFNKLLDSNTKDSVGLTQKINMVWSDPYDGYDEAFKNSSEVRYDFSKDQFIAFCKKYDIDVILRAHEQHNDGYKEYFDDRLISVFSSGGKNIDGESKNPNSYYDSVSPNFLQITNKEIKSININFDQKNLVKIEKEFQYEAIIENRNNHEKYYKFYIPQRFDDTFGNIVNSQGAINIIDRYNKRNKKVIILKNGSVELAHSDLQQFSSISKDLKFSIDKSKKTITNLCDLTLKIGIGGAVINKDETVNIEDKFIISTDNAFSLIVTI